MEKINTYFVTARPNDYKSWRSFFIDVDPRRGVFPVHIKSIDESGEFVIASWNGNGYDKMYQKQLDKYRVKPRNGKR